MRNRTFIMALVAVLALCTSPGAAELNWQTRKSDAISVAKNECKLILLLAGRDGCSNCFVMKNQVLESDTVKPLMEYLFVPWYCNIDQSDEYQQYRQGLDRLMLPLAVVIDPYKPDDYVARITNQVSEQEFSDFLEGALMENAPVFSQNPQDLSPLLDTQWEFDYTSNGEAQTDTLAFGNEVKTDIDAPYVYLDMGQGKIYYTPELPLELGGNSGYLGMLGDESGERFYGFSLYGTTASGYTMFQDFQSETCDIAPLTGRKRVEHPYSLWFPHVASGDQDAWETEVCVINDGDSALNGVFIPYDKQGNAVSQSVSVTLSPRARQALTVGEHFPNPERIGYIVFKSDSSHTVGYTKFFTPGVNRVAVPAVPDEQINTGDIYVPHIASTPYWWTGLSLVNTSQSQRDLILEFDNGAIRTISLAPGQHHAFMIQNLFDDVPQPDIGSARIKGADGVIGLELFSAASMLSGILLKDDLDEQMIYPHIASDNSWWTGVVAYNPEDTACQLTITAYDENGTVLGSRNETVQARTRYIGLAADLDLPAGTQWMRIDASHPISGFELFGTHDEKQLAGYTGVGIAHNQAFFPKLEKDGWTGIAFVNTGDLSASVTLQARDDAGQVQASTVLTLQAGQKRVAVAKDLFSSQDAAALEAATAIEYSAEQPIVGFQLNSAGGIMLDGLPGLSSRSETEETPFPEDTDDDGDGFTENQGDFDDTDASIYPGAPEVCGDGIDQDCDGADLPCEGDGEPANMAGMTAQHNYWRNLVGVAPLEWSAELADYAQEWADYLASQDCAIEHRPADTRIYGENIAYSWNHPLTPQEVVDAWGAEKADYDYETNTCNGPNCGHYTQMVWADTRYIGCAMATCGNEEIWVCNYDPPGNYSGQWPY